MPDAMMRTSTSSGSGAARSSVAISKGCERAGTRAAVIFIGWSSRKTTLQRKGRDGHAKNAKALARLKHRRVPLRILRVGVFLGGLRSAYPPYDKLDRKSATARLKASGWSRLAA